MESKTKAIVSVQDNLKFLGFYGIFKKSLKIILTWHKIFTQITLAFIFPHSCLYLANNWISKHLSSKIISYNNSSLSTKQIGSPTNDHFSNSSISSSEGVTYWLITATYFICSIILSLFTVSAVVYTVACIYSGKEIAFKKVLKVVPKVWKRLLITLLCNFCIVFAYVFALIFFVFMFATIYYIFFFKPEDMQKGLVMMMTLTWIMVIVLMVGIFYMTMIWQLGNVISVMEENCGFKALKKSKDLIKGKMGTSFAILLVISLCSTPIYLLIQQLNGVGIIGNIILGTLSLVLWSLVNLISLVVPTVFYLVCKSYHNESIDKSSLADHLDVCYGEYAPLKADQDDIQLEHFHV